MSELKLRPLKTVYRDGFWAKSSIFNFGEKFACSGALSPRS